MNIWEKFDKEFVMESDNQLAGGAPLLFRVWQGSEHVPYETRSLATKANVASFFKDEFDRVTKQRNKATRAAVEWEGLLNNKAGRLEKRKIAKRKFGLTNEEASKMFPLEKERE